MDDVVPFPHLTYRLRVSRIPGRPDEKIDDVFAPSVNHRRYRFEVLTPH
jgi:hypothetical protein